ncbi:SCO family protein [Pseudoalteromonas xiamenensis]|uniref:SCO family protein n=1 Tax=Pseudoalteromonas xiamenensis TaxID=882626 RepID=A0A975DJQ5_9GAMM|nr:SCO family protein [Pseudoalteromonas xiamenensis]QTH72992.1 SCO family protein [Pseudoalteromonas xiamenensis]
MKKYIFVILSFLFVAHAESVEIDHGYQTLLSESDFSYIKEKFGMKEDLVYVLAFGYTSCGYTCPIIASKLSYVKSKVGNSIDALFITVDPKIDTEDRLNSYLSSWGGIRGVRFDDYDDLSKISQVFKNYIFKYSDGEIDHSDIIYVIKGRVLVFYPNSNPDFIRDDVNFLVGEK